MLLAASPAPSGDMRGAPGPRGAPKVRAPAAPPIAPGATALRAAPPGMRLLSPRPGRPLADTAKAEARPKVRPAAMPGARLARAMPGARLPKGMLTELRPACMPGAD